MLQRCKCRSRMKIETLKYVIIELNIDPNIFFEMAYMTPKENIHKNDFYSGFNLKNLKH